MPFEFNLGERARALDLQRARCPERHRFLLGVNGFMSFFVFLFSISLFSGRLFAFRLVLAPPASIIFFFTGVVLREKGMEIG